jgi:small-conductance mechanosensitive channel
VITAVLLSLGVAGSILVGLGHTPVLAWGALGLLVAWGLWVVRHAASDLFSGVVLKAEGQLRPGSWIQVGSRGGVIQRLGWRALEVEMDDGSHLWMPFSRLARQSVALRSADGSGDAHTFALRFPDMTLPDQVVERVTRAAQLCPRSSLVRRPRVDVGSRVGEPITLRVTVYPIAPVFATEVEDFVRRSVGADAIAETGPA